MSLIDSLLSAIVRLDGDALVMHVGEKPYVVTSSTEMNAFRGPLAWGQVELSSKLLTTEAVAVMLDQLLPEEVRRSLEKVGAVEHELPQSQNDSRFVVIAARGGQDIWLEIRHIRPVASVPVASAEEPGPSLPLASVEEPAPSAFPVPEPAAAVEPAPAFAAATPAPEVTEPVPAVPEPAIPVTQAAAPEPVERLERAEPVERMEPVTPIEPQEPQEPQEPPYELIADTGGDIPEIEVVPEVSQETPTQADVDALLASTAASLLEAEGQLRLQDDTPGTPEPVASTEATEGIALDVGSLTQASARPEPAPETPAPSAAEESVLSETPPAIEAEVARGVEPAPTAVVVPLARVVREAPPPQRVAAPSDLDRLLRIAATRGASALYTV
ncbi:MAG: hypothetical protein ACRD1S_01420, partial [Vicinamibacterales bacterium]